MNRKYLIISLSIGGFFILCAFICCFGWLLADNKSSTIEITHMPTVVKSATVKPTPTKKIELKTYELSNGNYISGENFNPGIYDIIAIKGYGNVSSDNMFTGGLNAVMGIEHDAEKEYKNIELPNGTKLSIDGVTIKLVQKK